MSLATRVLVGVAARSLPATAETLPQWRALILLDGNDDTRVNVLATHLGIDPSTCTRLCDRLVGKGLIERQWSNDRRREVLLRLTAVESSLISEAPARRRGEIDRLPDRLSGREHEQLTPPLIRSLLPRRRSPTMHGRWGGPAD